jgi:hypothetical protein
MDGPDLRTWREWLQLLFPLLIFAVLFLWRQVRNYSRGRRLRELAPYLNGRAVLRPFSAPAITGLYLGYAYRMSFVPAFRNAPGRFELMLEFPFDFVLDIRPRAGARGVEAILSRGRAIQTGDRELDESVVVRSQGEPERAMSYLGRSACRRAVLDLVGQGFQLIRYTAKGVSLTKAGDFLGREGVSAQQILHDLSLAGRLVGG